MLDNQRVAGSVFTHAIICVFSMKHNRPWSSGLTSRPKEPIFQKKTLKVVFMWIWLRSLRRVTCASRMTTKVIDSLHISAFYLEP